MKLKRFFFLALICLIFFVNNSFAFNLNLIGINGKQTNVANFKGKVVVMTFFDISCYYCQKEVPTLNKLYELYGKNQKDVVIIGVDPFDHVEQIKLFGEQFSVKYPLYWGNYAQTAPLGGVFATPTSIFIDKQGVPKVRVPGQIGERDFIEIIRSLK
ncbi:MAG: TlpA family protein disulfide reductase [Desulfurella sp.]|uniref:TlpA family protein disulfide reductase n=1 Tax=Desulfurella sp. TaxID=1962857 RepID=UPI003CB98765